MNTSTRSRLDARPYVLAEQRRVITCYLIIDDDAIIGNGVDIWNIDSGQLENRIVPRNDPSCVTFNKDGTLVAIGDIDGTVQIYSEPLNDAVLIQQIEPEPREGYVIGHREEPEHVSFSTDGTKLLSMGTEAMDPDYVFGNDISKVCIWDVATGKCITQLVNLPPTTASFSPDGKRVVITTNGRLAIYDESIVEGFNNYMKTFELSPSNFTVATFSTDGLSIVAGTEGGELSVWKLNGSHDKPSKTINLGAKIELIKFSTSGDLLNIATSEKCFQYSNPGASLLLAHPERIAAYIDS